MASYQELHDLGFNGDMLAKIAVAVAIKAADIVDNIGTATDAQKKWAANAVAAPSREAKRVWPLVIAANSSLTVAQITGASDSAIQTNVNSAVDLLTAADALA